MLSIASAQRQEPRIRVDHEVGNEGLGIAQQRRDVIGAMRDAVRQRGRA